MSDPKWTIIIDKYPQKVLRRIPKNLLRRIDAAIMSLATNPRPPGFKKLVGYENLYRIRVGDWRIIYAAEDDRLIIVILEVSPRGGAYRSF